MRRVLVACTVALLVAGTMATPAAEALTIFVTDSLGNQVGFIDVDESPDGSGIQGWFQSTWGDPPSLDAAAEQCGEHHFNWLQVVVSDNMPPVGADGLPLEPPYLDPPSGGLPGQWADGLPWYWDEEIPDDPLTPSWDPIYNLPSQLDDSNGDGIPDQLRYEDFPGGPAGTEVEFVTWLASLNEDGSVHSYHGGFSWSWSAPEEGDGGGGGGRELNWGLGWGTATLDPTPLSGDQAWYYHNLLVPEPSTYAMLATAALGLLVGVCRRRRRIG